MAELGDALGSGPSARKGVGVQIPFPALLYRWQMTDNSIVVAEFTLQ
jgi:hypothetical protein